MLTAIGVRPLLCQPLRQSIIPIGIYRVREAARPALESTNSSTIVVVVQPG
jgi:hypothetical protein